MAPKKCSLSTIFHPNYPTSPNICATYMPLCISHPNKCEESVGVVHLKHVSKVEEGKEET